ncbi:cytochrome B5 [Geothermobacter hydrogeniphilus]|uniref:Cytochrome B5 n=2 Tax=Geothermobacter hydrogeniphilus TaxID=1969733 RepID=A0A1X0XT29_9BACT|nr:cytochrome B5 [Geothermobacter hydrogeniphilus]
MRIPMLFLLLLLLSVGLAGATEKFARKTGHDCNYCHLNPAGGGELTAAGEAFIEQQAAAGAPVTTPVAGRILRLLVGFLHLFTAVFWFGTIFYVHLVLKPAYASQGLPRSEVRVGLVSMVVMAVTGAYLTWLRVDSFETLLHTSFGILLLVKIGLFGIMVALALLAVFVIGPKLRQKRGATQDVVLGDMTTEQLARCDGKDGHPVCFAFQGRIFNAGNSPLWKGGEHMKRHPAGTDLSEALGQAPHGADRVLKLPDVGQLLPTTEQQTEPAPKRLFYLFAYLNLGLAIAILMVVALWRWN